MNIQDNFVLPNDPVLTRVAQKVPQDKITSLETKKDIEKMLKVAFGEQTDFKKPLLVGLGAPQIGISKRIILVDLKASGRGNVGDLRVYINPEITYKSKAENEWYEGCYSTSNVCGIVSRPTKIRIKAFNQKGETIKEEHQGYTARIFQHEIDHLRGIEFVTHITDDNNLHWVKDSEYPEYRNNKGWRNWPKKCSRAKWQEIKGLKKEELFKLGVKALIRNSQGKILLIKSIKDQVEYWDLPGGKVYEGDSLEQTLKRELQEELGIKKIKQIEFFSACTSPLLRQYFSTGLALYIYSCITPTEKFILSDEHSEYKWILPKKAAQLLKTKYTKNVTAKIKSL